MGLIFNNVKRETSLENSVENLDFFVYLTFDKSFVIDLGHLENIVFSFHHTP